MKQWKEQAHHLARIVLAATAEPEDHRRHLKQMVSKEGGKGDPKGQENPHLGKKQ